MKNVGLLGSAVSSLGEGGAQVNPPILYSKLILSGPLRGRGRKRRQGLMEGNRERKGNAGREGLPFQCTEAGARSPKHPARQKRRELLS
jgi:hypothetical protein